MESEHDVQRPGITICVDPPNDYKDQVPQSNGPIDWASGFVYLHSCNHIIHFDLHEGTSILLFSNLKVFLMSPFPKTSPGSIPHTRNCKAVPTASGNRVVQLHQIQAGPTHRAHWWLNSV